jgi:hypothetical protein
VEFLPRLPLLPDNSLPALRLILGHDYRIIGSNKVEVRTLSSHVPAQDANKHFRLFVFIAPRATLLAL